MALRAVINSRIPMVIILGATGTGKTKLGVELAQKFGTEIISADSMQIYKGLDVVTAKASFQEREMAKHHLLDILEPHQMFTVVDFRNRALKIIDDLIEHGKIPIIVGGTNYYIESIVYRILVEDMNDEQALLWDKSRKKKSTERNESDAKRIRTDNLIDSVNKTDRKDTESASPAINMKEIRCESDAKRIKTDNLIDSVNKTDRKDTKSASPAIDMKETKKQSDAKRIRPDNLIDNVNKIDKKHTEAESSSSTSVDMIQTKNESITKNTKIHSDSNIKRKDNNLDESAGSSSVVEKEVTHKMLIDKLKYCFDNEEDFTNEDIHERLREVDPVMAGRLHPNNRRKVLRSIEVWLKSGRLHSEILSEQKLSEGQLRRHDSTIILWLKCEQTVHDKRLDDRVDAMLKDGLIEELLDFHSRHNRDRIQDERPPDYTKGIFQTLGFKEFHEYLMLNDEEKQSERGCKLLEQSIDNMKLATRRYARRQNKMVKGRFLEHPDREIPPVYELDTTDVAKWDENVKNKAIHIIESFINNSTCNYEPVKSIISEDRKKMDRNSYNYCETCQRIIIGDNVYAAHLNSFRHSKVVKLKKKLAEKEKQKTGENETENQQN